MNVILKEMEAVIQSIKEIETMKLLILSVLVISLVYLFRKVIAKILAKKYNVDDMQSYRTFVSKNKSKSAGIGDVLKEWELIGKRPDDR